MLFSMINAVSFLLLSVLLSHFLPFSLAFVSSAFFGSFDLYLVLDFRVGGFPPLSANLWPAAREAVLRRGQSWTWQGLTPITFTLGCLEGDSHPPPHTHTHTKVSVERLFLPTR